ncbi:MAG: diacylglycerol kinase family protein [Clostridia bacterium]|nr:diacylglycerol kinase family protein [Clostridia bacterium]
MKARNVRESFGFAGLGIAHAYRTERNLRIHVVAVVLVGAMCMVLRVDSREVCLLALAATIVLSAEMINTAVELCVDLVTQEFHPLAAAAKNVAAGAVLVSVVGAVAVGLGVFGPRLFAIIKGLAR